MAKQTITKAEYCELLGLMLLAIKHAEMMGDLARAGMAITGEQEGKFSDFKHTGDAMYGTEGSAAERTDKLLRKLNIVVSE